MIFLSLKIILITFLLFQIIYDINFNFVEELKKRIGLDYDRLSRMSIVEEAAVKVPREASYFVLYGILSVFFSQ